ncbi:DUF5342 family protein [Scopulibacillus cellulosilyticus]|uniref:DUF5342 family protein n=1 Tax=Scopulibacillus cellulosilyticus TaxID=2665665 RepID=A0ABW2Q3D9_9BACL
MFKDFEIKPMFEDQIHERHQFSLNILGSNYSGIYHKGDIQWFNPHPKNNLSNDHLGNVESKIHELLFDYLKQ